MYLCSKKCIFCILITYIVYNINILCKKRNVFYRREHCSEGAFMRFSSIIQTARKCSILTICKLLACVINVNRVVCLAF